MNKEMFIQFFTSFLNKVISKSLKVIVLFPIFIELLWWQLLKFIREILIFKSKLLLKNINITRCESYYHRETIQMLFSHTQILTLDQVVGCGASGS